MFRNINAFLNFNRFGFSSKSKHRMHGTTVLAIKRNKKVVFIADGQMTLGHTVFKNDTKKIIRLTDNIMCGYAGSVADCHTLMDKLETEVEQYPTDLLRASVNLAKYWRGNRSLKNASLIVADQKVMLNIDGEGNVIEIKDILGIGSGGIYAQSAAKALFEIESLSTEEIAKKAMKIAEELCIYTNDNTTIDSIDCL
jgi:ATP-dependent HslUV protease subunit HslV